MSSDIRNHKHADFDVSVITTDAEFADLQAPWTALVEQAESASVFLSYEWFRGAWAWRRLDSSLFILTVRHSGALVGILPLIREQPGGAQLRRLSLLTVPDTQWSDVIVAADLRTNVCQALAQTLAARRDWDVMELRYLPAHSNLLHGLVPELAPRCSTSQAIPMGRNSFISLEGHWSEYYGTRSRSLKKANNLAANRLAKAGAIRIAHIEPGKGDALALAAALDSVIDVSRRSWKQSTGNSLDQAGPGAFIRTLSQGAHQRGWLSMWLAYLDDRPVAMEYQLVYNGSVHALRADFVAECVEISPGTFLFRNLLESLFNRGLSRYYMGPGDNPYKARWTDEGEPVIEVSVHNRTLGGVLSKLWQSGVRPRLRHLRDRLSSARSLRSADLARKATPDG